MDALKMGERVLHPLFGLGSVLADEKDGRVEVQFDQHDRKMLALKYALLRRVSPDEEAAIRTQAQASFAQTFEFESDGGEHSPGSHWPPFFEDFAQDALTRLPTLMREATQAMGVSDFDRYRAPALPADWPKALRLRWPPLDRGIIFVLKAEADRNVLSAMFPWISRGTQARLEVSRVHVFASGVEAQVEATIGAASITFYDTDFTSNAGWYRTGAAMEFILCGLAYACEPAQEPDMLLDADSPVLQDLRKAAIEAGHDPAQVTDRIGFKGAAVLLPIDEWDRDDYQFRGTIEEVEPYPMLECDGWMLKVCVLRDFDDDDQNFALRILVTSRVWAQPEPPQAGEDVCGAMWLQGRLWLPPTE